MTKARDLGDNAQNTKPKVINAKGDLIVGTGSDAADRLAVSDNGSTLVADSSQTTGLRYNPQNALANPVVNGGMDIWQRGTSFSVTSSVTNYFTADRWSANRQATGLTVSRQTVSDATNLPNIQYCARVQRDSGNATNHQISLFTNFETVNSIPYAGKTITVSFYARAGANYSPSSSIMQYSLVTGTGTDQNAINGFTGSTVSTQNATLTTTWQRFAYTNTVATNVTQIALFFQSTPTGTAGANDWFEVTGVQVDLGTYTASTAPTFRRSGGTLAGELAACQRYYYRLNSSAGANIVYGRFGLGQMSSSTQGQVFITFPVSMRVGPTALEQSGTASNYAIINSVGQVIALTAVPSHDLGSSVGATLNVSFSATSTAAGQALQMLSNNNTTSYLGWSAEL